MQELKKRAEMREPPPLGRRVTETVAGLLIVLMVGFLKWQADLGDLWFGVGLLLGGTFISKSLTIDLLASIKDRLK